MARIIENPEGLILKTAGALFDEEGMSGVNMRAVAKRCGIALGTIYNYYPSKGDLFMALMKDYWRAYLMETEQMLTESGDPFMKLRRLESELRVKVSRFKQGWLIPELYEKPDLIEEGVGHEHHYLEYLVRIIARFVKESGWARSGDQGVEYSETAVDLARFIVSNLLGMIQQPVMEYDLFEKYMKTIIIQGQYR